MVRRKKDSLYIFLLAITALFILWFILSRLRIVVVTFLPWWMLGLLILVAAAIILLAIDHFINRS